MSKLALLGGKPIIKKSYPDYISIKKEEAAAAARVMKRGHLSCFFGSNHENFYGGPEVRAIEKEWAAYFKIKYAVTLNSAASGILAAVGALEIGPGDEVIVTPYSMSCSATAPLFYGAIPVFADIEEETFGLDPKSIEKLISPNTKAIIVVHLAGHTARMNEILKIAKKHNVKIIEDCAQAPGATDNGRFAGTFGDIGVFSLNCHKIINTGEGGVCVTNDEELAKRLQLIRNHAEAVIGGGFKTRSLVNMVGLNLRMGEVEAAVAREQLKKLDELIRGRIDLADRLTSKLRQMPGIIPPPTRKHCKHSWYMYCARIDTGLIKISRNLFVKALAAEGLPFVPGYVEPLYLLPVFQRKIAIGRHGFPFTHEENKSLNQNYKKGSSPVCERIENKELIQCWTVRPPLTYRDMDDIARGFEKVLGALAELAELDKEDGLELPSDSAGRRTMFRKLRP